MDTPDFKGTLVFTGGGTGGHFFPAVALAEGARARWPGRPIAFVGARRGIEARRLPESGWPHLLLDVEGLVGRSPFAILRALRLLLRARGTLLRAWRTSRPVAVVATGGYGAAPALLAARKLGIPTFLHESNAEPGLVVRLLARGAREVWLGMAAARERLPGAACRVVGTPVRAAFLRDFSPLEDLRAPFRLLALGGSGGARPLNEALLALAPGLLERHPDWELLHQTGARDFEALAARPRHPRHRLQAFLEDVDRELEAASLVLSRSGASTCAELAACGRPAILVPFPQSAGDHQTHNARALEAEGRAVCVLQGPDLPERLAAEVERLMADGEARRRLARPEPNCAVEACLEAMAPLLA